MLLFLRVVVLYACVIAGAAWGAGGEEQRLSAIQSTIAELVCYMPHTCSDHMMTDQ